ncbi:MAG: FAD/NAD(P)-binding protein [Anaerolineales bacterium]|jgi:NAD(P)H-flavin reductase
MTTADIVRDTKPTAWMAPHPVRIEAIEHETENVATYRLAFIDPEIGRAYRFQPGQFNMLYVPGVGEAAISISSDPEDHAGVDHTIRFVGNVTGAIRKMAVGDVLGMRGPFGHPWPLDAYPGSDVVIAAGGIGLPPLRPVIHQLILHRENFGRIVVLYGARSPDELLFTEAFEGWKAYGIEVEVTVDRADASWHGQVGVVPMLFYRLRLNPANTVVFSCGPEIMMRFVVFEALARKVPADRIFLSMERNMRCGQGACGHCQIGPYFVCQDGPVLSYARLEPFFSVEDF